MKQLHTVLVDRTVKIYNVSETSYELSATLQGHEVRTENKFSLLLPVLYSVLSNIELVEL